MKKKELLVLLSKLKEFFMRTKTQRICFAMSALYIFNLIILPVSKENDNKKDIPESTIEQNGSFISALAYMVEVADETYYIFEDVFQKAEIQNIINDILIKENLTEEGLNQVLDNLVDNPIFDFKYSSREEALYGLAFNEHTYEEKMLIVMARRGNTYEEVDTVCAGGVAEASGEGTNYIDAYAVGSTIINRTRYRSYYNTYGDDIYKIFTGPKQFSVYSSGLYKRFLGRIDLPGYQAMIDVLYSEESMHDYLEFRGNRVNLTIPYETFTDGGNKHIIKMQEEYIVDPSELNLENSEEVARKLEM